MGNRIRVPVVMAVDDNYCKYMAVAAASILDHRSGREVYSFHVLHRNITEAHQGMLRTLVQRTGGSDDEVYFHEVTGLLDSSRLYLSGHVTEETYYRLLIPRLLPQYDKVLYLDCDLVVRSCLLPLYETELSDNLIAGVITVGNEKRRDYCRQVLGISEEHYINAGVLVLNLKALREFDLVGGAYQMLEEKKALQWHDQDILNTVCCGRITFLDPTWNTTVLRLLKEQGTGNAAELRLNHSVPDSQSSEKSDEHETDTRNEGHSAVSGITCSDSAPAILHYASVKPWNSELKEIDLPFWHYVDGNPFSREILEAYHGISDSRLHYSELAADGKIPLSELLCNLRKGIDSRFRNRSR